MDTVDVRSAPNPLGVVSDTLDEPVELVWRCLDCGYQRQSIRHLDRCPHCGASADRVAGRTSVAWRTMLRAERAGLDRAS